MNLSSENKRPPRGLRVDDLPAYVLGHIAQAVHEARTAGVDVVDLSQINPNLGVPPAALDRVVQSCLRPQHHQYSSSQGIGRLRAAIAEQYQQTYDIALDPESQIVVTMGVKEGLGHMLLAAIRPGETVIVPTPSYPVHSAAISIASAGMVGVSLFDSPDTAETQVLSESAHGFFDRLREACERTWPKPRAVVLSFPHNPTGVVVTPGFFERVCDMAEQYDLLVLHDFAYADINFSDVPQPSVLAGSGKGARVVEFRSLSKSHGLAGWRVGFCVGDATLIEALKRLKSYLDFGIFQPLQLGAIDALEDRDDFVAAVTGTYRARRDILVSGLREAGWTVSAPEAGVLVWARLPESYRSLGSLACADYFMRAGRVALCPGEGFDPAMREYMRFSLGEDEARIQEAIRRLQDCSPEECAR